MQSLHLYMEYTVVMVQTKYEIEEDRRDHG